MGSRPATVKKADTRFGYLLFGAGNRTRTGTLFTARDFKSPLAEKTKSSLWLYAFSFCLVFSQAETQGIEKTSQSSIIVSELQIRGRVCLLKVERR